MTAALVACIQPDMQSQCAQFLVSGRVQGVGFRYFVRGKAAALGVGGFVRNLPDGQVECVARGKPEQLLALEEELRRGPPLSRVDSVARTDLTANPPRLAPGFRITD